MAKVKCENFVSQMARFKKLRGEIRAEERAKEYAAPAKSVDKSAGDFQKQKLTSLNEGTSVPKSKK